MDVRTRYTKQALKDALVEILEGRQLHEVTVKELCARAGVNRSTLYAHYGSIYDLYDEAESEFLDEIVAVSSENSGSRTDAERLANYAAVCTFYQQNRDRLLAFYRTSTSPSFVDRIGERFLAVQFRQADAQELSSAQIKEQLAFGYLNAGYMHVIFSWLLMHPKMLAEDVANILISIHNDAHQALASFVTRTEDWA